MDDKQVTARKTLEAQLIDRAMKDAAFREQLLRDPKAVFARALGIEVLEAARSPTNRWRRRWPSACYIHMVCCYTSDGICSPSSVTGHK